MTDASTSRKVRGMTAQPPLPGPQVCACAVPSPSHDLPDHPENPRRFQGFEKILHQFLEVVLEPIDPTTADEAHLLRVRRADFPKALHRAVEPGPYTIDYASSYVTPSSYDGAQLPAGTVVEMATRVWRREADSGFAQIRPPGHHATATQPMGFCLLNIAIAARRLQAPGAGA